MKFGIKILIVQTPAFNPLDGGVQRITYNLGDFFSASGLEVLYYSFATTGHISPKKGVLRHSAHLRGLNNKKNMNDFESVIRDFQPTVVINQMIYENKLNLSLGILKNKVPFKLIGCLHNSLFAFRNNVKDKLKDKLSPIPYFLLSNPISIFCIRKWHEIKHRNTLLKILDTHDRFVTEALPNQEELKYFVGNYGDRKVLTIPNPFPFKITHNRNKEKIILHVGRINVPQKRSDLLLDFWEKTYADIPDWKFIVIGDGPYLIELEKQLIKRGLPRMELLGYMDPEPFYKKASIFMMPSAYEGMPNTIVEAQSYGCPIIAFNSYLSLSWIVNDGDDGKLIPPFYVAKMAKTTIDLVSNSSELERMRINALDNSKRFAIDKVGKEWLTLFEELINEGS